MAIGLGKMFGFHFPENFNYPYMAKSISEFWKRWHISLSSWFRDYIYIPLGGSRVGKSRLLMNLLAVWVLTGIWHGASWNFVIWGIYYFILLVFEKLTGIPDKIQSSFWKIMWRIFTLICVNIGWIIFRAPDFSTAVNYIGCLFGMNGNHFLDAKTVYILKDYFVMFVAAIILATPIYKKIETYMEQNQKMDILFVIMKSIGLIVLFLICTAYSVNSKYNPFIYFNF